MKITKSIKTLIVGFGPLGKNLAQSLDDDSRFELLAIVDNDEAKQGQEFADIKIETDLKKVLETNAFDLAFLVTSSKLENISDSLKQLARAKVNVISSCEELIFPLQSHPEFAKELDDLAKEKEVRFLGTGINPGFLMDYLITVMAKPFLGLKKVFYQRKINTKQRRSSFQNKVGVDMSVEQFAEMKSQGKIGHIGFKQSADMIAYNFSWNYKYYDESIEPVIKDGVVKGIDQNAIAKFENGRSIEFVFKAVEGLDDSDKLVLDFDSIDVPVLVNIPSGINGESATVAMLMNSAGRLLIAQPGLRTMLDI